MKAVWLVRWQELTGRARFWIAIVDYDPHERSLSHSIYLLYVLIFFSLWGFAVLALLADLGTIVLSLANGLEPSSAAVLLLMLVLLLVTFIQGYRSGVRSPFIFSETDAELICQTPVNRGQVAVAWFLGDWFPGGLFFTALAIVFRFSSLQMMAPGGFQWEYLPAFLLAAVQAACIIFPLHLALLALAYALGALRLHADTEFRWLRWVPVVAIALLAFLFLQNISVAQASLWPMMFPIRAAFGMGYWLSGFIVALFLAILSLSNLYWTGRGLNLSRAAQESRFLWAVKQVAWVGDASASQAMKTRQKLGIGHMPSRLPARQGIFSLIWKRVVVTTRLPGFSSFVGWVGIFGLGLGLLLASDWGSRLWAFVLWSLLVARRCTGDLRNDLSVWSLTRQLPFSARDMLLAQCVSPSIIAILVSCLSFFVTASLDFGLQGAYILLVPAAVLCVTLSAALDLLRHCRGSDLLAGRAAEFGAGGLILGLILAGLPVALVSWLSSLYPGSGILLLFALLGLVLGMGAAWGILSLASIAYKNIR